MIIANQASAIGLLALSILVICNFVLTASGLFPAEKSTRERFGDTGALGLYLVLGFVALLVIHVVAFTAEHTTWYFAVITTGFMLLASPWVHQLLPQRIQNEVAGVFVFGACAALMHVVLFSA